ncbi:NAD(P)H-dependent glycerol-3-phosphate dehydrogenase [Candidatus Chrysopegis kryptomonas]|uniref:Glycerol-3-phosphate dehydrogenase [NAD(P)+] n=1 Tax=Candidatus Chryseopegocella kryptomonas TaxID=1633643 RepID=A0A0P1NZ13_9BACT|nr:NAD(P)H-dependent glycerol-3-phosphate dehydrogenase [Candidatus Chrysopegis kryptomonas]CUT04414.1 glycerol 3-phosphate dehydrogenase (NAD(P)+) [Candidatus Chrysopegis kryptomonas]
MRISIIGSGSWGTTLAILLYDNRHSVKLWFRRKEHLEEVKTTGENHIYLPGVKIPSEIFLTSDLEEALDDVEIIVLAVPTQHLRAIISRDEFKSVKDKIFVNVAKGIENKTLMRVSEILKDLLGVYENYCVLSGPSHAEEVSRKMPTAVVVSSFNKSVASLTQNVFMNNYFRVYTSDDVVGVELGGALKNIIAIATGIADGIGFGDNTRAAIMTRGIAEIVRLGVAMGARIETFAGLSGIGDLIVTCTSKYSRNRFVGEQIGKGKKLEEILKNMVMVAEGIWTTISAVELAKKFEVEMPITNAVYDVLFNGKNPIQATSELMGRTPKPEVWGLNFTIR